MKNKFIKAISPLAQKLIDKRKSNKDSVKVDHLSFSFKLADLRHCHRAGFAGATAKKQNFFPLPPKIKSTVQLSGLDQEQSHKELEKERLRVQRLKMDFYQETLKRFISHVLGFELSAPRDKGFHGYHNSMTLKSLNGSDVGFVGIGGQQDTCYIQISGNGCKHLFSHIQLFALHHWLSTVLGITHLSRLDLCKDDYDNNFNCDYAMAAYKEGWFRSGSGGRMPVVKDASEYVFDEDFNRICDVEMINVGKRTSPIYWRIYNKKLEQGITDNRLIWFRSEVELKKWNVDALLNVDEAFAGINQFSKSMTDCDGVRTKSMSSSKEAALDLASRAKWFRHAAGKALVDVLELLDGDIEQAIGYLLPNDRSTQISKMGIPPTYSKLINHALEC